MIRWIFFSELSVIMLLSIYLWFVFQTKSVWKEIILFLILFFVNFLKIISYLFTVFFFLYSHLIPMFQEQMFWSVRFLHKLKNLEVTFHREFGISWRFQTPCSNKQMREQIICFYWIWASLVELASTPNIARV